VTCDNGRSLAGLWFPMGLHAGWNFSEGSLYGPSVSGFTAKNALTQGSLTGPVILTGGSFGPEASIVAVLLCFGVAILLLWRAAKLRRTQPPHWSRRIRVEQGRRNRSSDSTASLIGIPPVPRYGNMGVWLHVK
jgi:hypothetical protein